VAHLISPGQPKLRATSGVQSLGAADTSVRATSWLRSIFPNYPKSPADIRSSELQQRAVDFQRLLADLQNSSGRGICSSPQVGQAVLAFARSYSNSGPNSVRAGRRAPPAPPAKLWPSKGMDQPIFPARQKLRGEIRRSVVAEPGPGGVLKRFREARL
jgi:hypothetical protein